MLHAETWGPNDAPTVVCLHGLTGHARRYRRLAEERLPHRRVVALDLRGHGRSPFAPPWGIAQHVADLVEAADALGLRGAPWIGHSYGGRLVAEFAARTDGVVGSAVLLDPAMHIDPAVAGARAALARGDLSFGSHDEAVAYRLADGSLFTTTHETLEEEMREHLVAGADGRLRYRVCPEMAVVAWSEMATPSPAWPVCPTLVVLGARSWLPVDLPARDGTEIVTVPGGHSVLWDDFDATADAIARFVG